MYEGRVRHQVLAPIFIVLLRYNILEARSLTVGLTSIVSLNGCQKTSSVYYKLPLYSSIVGNATGGILSADAGFYFQDWHVVPSLGFCPSNNPPTNPIPALTPVAQAAADSSRRKLLAAGSSSRSSSSSAGDIDLHNKKLRKLWTSSRDWMATTVKALSRRLSPKALLD